MKLDEAIKQCNDLINDFENGNGEERVNATDIQAIETVLKELDNSISKDKIREKIKELKYESWYIKDWKFNKFQEKIYNSGILFGKNIVLQELLKENKDVN